MDILNNVFRSEVHPQPRPSLVQIMTCRLFGANHYLNQCYHFINCTQRNMLIRSDPLKYLSYNLVAIIIGQLHFATTFLPLYLESYLLSVTPDPPIIVHGILTCGMSVFAFQPFAWLLWSRQTLHTWTQFYLVPPVQLTLKTWSCHDANFVVTGDTQQMRDDITL